MLKEAAKMQKKKNVGTLPSRLIALLRNSEKLQCSTQDGLLARRRSTLTPTHIRRHLKTLVDADRKLTHL